MANPDIKILIAAHSRVKLVDAKNLYYIQVGAALAKKHLHGMAYYDDMGDNISRKNREYCELTAIYWAWKNLDADYYGLFHYRRFLNFSGYNKTVDNMRIKNTGKLVRVANLNDASIRKALVGCDILLPAREDVRDMGPGPQTIREQFISVHDERALNSCLKYIKTRFSDIAKFESALDAPAGYFYNMFVMRREIFEEYCAFIFDTLSYFEQHYDISSSDSYQRRLPGFLAERLLNIFIAYKKSQFAKIKELPEVFIVNTETLSSRICKRFN